MAPTAVAENSFIRVGFRFSAVLITFSAVLSLVTIISIYREGGILKRLRATPLRPQTILSAHVLVKLILTAATLALMVLAGKRYYPVGVHVPVFSFTVALLISTWSILSIGFLIASIVPTARFAQPIGAVILYPMIGLCGLFTPLASLPPVSMPSRVLPLTMPNNARNLEWRRLVRTHRRRRRVGADLRGLHRALLQSFSLAVVRFVSLLRAPYLLT